MKSKRLYRIITTGATVSLLIAIAGIGLRLQDSSSAATPTARNKYLWPFAASSPWNTPVGSGAVYQHAGLSPANAWKGNVTSDKVHISLDRSDPIKVLNGVQRVHVDPALNHSGSWNGIGVLLREGGNTYAEGQTMYLSPGGNPTWEHKYNTDADLKGNGIRGAHGGSAMSGLGGTIRAHEWNATAEPIRHALAINLYGLRFMSSANGGYRWPATKADSGYDSGDTTVPTNFYGRTGKGYDFVNMGSLLALKPDFNVAALSDPQARRIAQALKDYGGYVVDNTAWDVHALSVEHTVDAAYNNQGAAFHSQLMSVFTNLHGITNNSPTSVGGGGTPRAPLAPCFDDEPNCSTTSPTPPPPASPPPTPPPAGSVSQSGNIATGKTFISSVTDPNPSFGGLAVNDASESTRWISQPQDNVTLTTNLGTAYTINKISILWAGNTTRNYDVQMSPDNVTWQTIASGTTNNTAVQFIDTTAFTGSPSGQYLRILAKDRWNSTYGNSIFEIGLYGTAMVTPPVVIDPVVNILAGKTVTSSAASNAAYPLSNINNNNRADRWISAPQDNVSVTADMTSAYTLNKISILWAGDTTRNYDIQISDDNSSWRTIASGTTNNTAQQLIDTSSFTSPATGRYLRILAKDRWNSTYGHSIYELIAYGTTSSTALLGDANNDKRVNALDLSLLLTNDGRNYPAGDFNKDGTVGAADLAILLSKWTW